MDYINKAECESRGLIRGNDGLYRKLSVLEKYETKGWLNFGNRQLSSSDRLQAGLNFFRDFTASKLDTLTAIDWTVERVDTSGRGDVSPAVWDARVRFSRSLCAINGRYLNVVVRVCLNDKPLNVIKLTNAQYNHDLEMAKECLCCGLDDLAYHYGFRPSRPKIQGCGDYRFFDGIEEWYNAR